MAMIMVMMMRVGGLYVADLTLLLALLASMSCFWLAYCLCNEYIVSNS